MFNETSVLSTAVSVNKMGLVREKFSTAERDGVRRFCYDITMQSRKGHVVIVRRGRSFCLFGLAVATALCCVLSATAAAVRVPVTQRYPFQFGTPHLSETAAGIEVSLEGCDVYGVPGAPLLPVRAVHLEAPDGYQAAEVRIVPGATTVQILENAIAFAQEAVPLDVDPRRIAPTRRNATLYNRRSPYPAYGAAEGRRWRVDRRHGRDEVTLLLHPVQVVPALNQLLCHAEITVEVDWVPVDTMADDASAPAKGAMLLPRLLTATVRSLVSPLASARYDHVIVAPMMLVTNTTEPWNLDTLVAARQEAGLSSTVVTVEWIYAHYAGRDKAEQIRAFLCDAYQTWSTRFTLLVGTAQLVPTRLLHCAFGEGEYTAEIPSDSLYYGCLDGDFDYNGNNVFGEIGDGADGRDVDLLAEIQVGRFPVANALELAHMVRKTLLYEAVPATQLTRVAHVGEYLGFGDVADYATGAMEQIRWGTTDAGFTTLGCENPVYGSVFDTATTLYDAPGTRWPKSGMFALLNQNIHVFNHLGHGAPRICFKINLGFSADRQALAGLTNTLPCLAYSQACEAGRFDDYTDCFAEQFVTAPAGAFAAVMNPRSGWGYRDRVDGPSHRFHRMFWDAIFSEEVHHLGAANAKSKERLRHLVDPYAGDVFRWCIYEIMLFGDPATPFAARALQQAPVFGHIGMDNQYQTDVPYPCEVEMGPVGLVDSATPRLVWWTSVEPAVVHTNLLTRMAPSRYAATIPAQPLGARIHYSLLAETVAGVSGQWPETGEHTFAITLPITLNVLGDPQAWGAVVPNYGSHTLASGTVVRAEAPARVITSPGVSQALVGYVGSGSVAPSAPLAAVDFVLDEPSALTWLWRTENALQHTSNVPNRLDSLLWMTPDTVATSVVAPTTVVVNRQTLAFAGWTLDGQRQPDAPGAVANPVVGIAMSAPHVVYAHYLPLTQDNDRNGLPDWWEFWFYGAAGHPSGADDDGDGFSTAQEYADRTDPLDPRSYPQPPLIQHTPLAASQDTPPPYAINAVITDSFRVEAALLLWRRNGEPWQTNSLVRQDSGDDYRSMLSSPGLPHDQFDYQIVARDPAGHTAIHGPHTVLLAYAQIALSPTSGVQAVVTTGGEATAALTLTNTGNTRLSWSLQQGTIESVDGNTNAWTLDAFAQPWVRSAARYASPTLSFLGHAVSGGGGTTPAVHAGLLSPPFDLVPGASLFFKYWISGELDSRNAEWAFDGGLVEVSTDDGETFQQLEGPYTHLISGWTYSPWPDGTPCFSGDGSEGWREAIFTLDAYAGQQVRLRFVVGGDNNTDGEGWYVDDIRVGPVAAAPWPDWLACGATTGMLIPGHSFAIPLFFMADGAPHRDERLPLHVVSNDPVHPNIYADVSLKIRDAPWLGAVTAVQTSRRGEGVVSLSAAVAEADGEPLQVEASYSRDAGDTWSAPTLFQAQVAFGSCRLNAAAARAEQVPTTLAGTTATNRVTLLWDTWATSLPPLVPEMRVRLRAVSAYFASPAVVSAPFIVDNQSPPEPTTLRVVSHATGIWSRAATLLAQWQPVSDGAGVGGISYRWKLCETANDTFTNTPHTTATAVAAVAPDGSNLWFGVRAVDAFGNASGVIWAGPYYVDTAPPFSSGALYLRRSAFGPYAVGPQLCAIWDGFSDAHSGIAGYYLLHQAEGALTPPMFTTSSAHLLDRVALDATNHVMVFAVDRVGNASAIVADAVWVLDPEGDSDGDGHTAAEEELAGTHAADGASVLRIGLTDVHSTGDAVTLNVVWDSVRGRRYTLLGTPSLTAPAWQPLPGKVDLPGEGRVVTNAVTLDTPLFLRLSVSKGPDL